MYDSCFTLRKKCAFKTHVEIFEKTRHELKHTRSTDQPPQTRTLISTYPQQTHNMLTRTHTRTHQHAAN